MSAATTRPAARIAVSSGGNRSATGTSGDEDKGVAGGIDSDQMARLRSPAVVSDPVSRVVYGAICLALCAAALLIPSRAAGAVGDLSYRGCLANTGNNGCV